MYDGDVLVMRHDISDEIADAMVAEALFDTIRAAAHKVEKEVASVVFLGATA